MDAGIALSYVRQISRRNPYGEIANVKIGRSPPPTRQAPSLPPYEYCRVRPEFAEENRGLTVFVGDTDSETIDRTEAKP